MGSRPNSRAVWRTAGRRPPNGGRKRLECCPMASSRAERQAESSWRISATLLKVSQGWVKVWLPTDVAGLEDFASEVGALLDEATDQEKCGFHTVLCQNFQQTQRVGVVGAVVVGERESFGSGGEAGEGAAVPLCGWGQGLVARGHGRDGSCSGKHRSEHGRIVMD